MGQHHFGSRRNQEKDMVVKTDLANAFDRVRHAFLFKVMRRFGFDPAFIRWVKYCISEPWISPLINDREASFFKEDRTRYVCSLLCSM